MREREREKSERERERVSEGGGRERARERESDGGMEGGREGERGRGRERASRVYLPATPHLYDALSLSLSFTNTHKHTQLPHMGVSSHVQRVHLVQPPAMNILTRERVRGEKAVRESVREEGG